MKKYLKTVRRASAICSAVNDLASECMVALFLLLTSSAFVLWLWWYPIDYLTEGETFHERRLAKYAKCAGFKDIANVSVAVPDNQFRDFETSCSVWVTSDKGETYRPLEFTYHYERRGWLDGRAAVRLARGAFAEKNASVLDRYLEWSGDSREQYETWFAKQDEHPK